MDRNCKNNPDRVCYICGNVVLPNRQAKITDFMKKACHDYFGIKLGDRNKPFAPLVFYKICVENLRDQRNDKKKIMPFTIPMVWKEGKYHITDCYFCKLKLKGIDSKNKHHVQYPRCSFCYKTNPSCLRPSCSSAGW